MKIAITGHRPDKLGYDYDLVSPLIQKIITEIELIIAREKPDTLISGMALGIDTLFAKIAMFMEIKLIAAIPCLWQEYKWSKKSQDLYHKILGDKNTRKVYVSRRAYTSYCMQDRNKWMVDECDLLIAVWDGSPGGTANCVEYAKSVNRRIIIINPKEI